MALIDYLMTLLHLIFCESRQAYLPLTLNQNQESTCPRWATCRALRTSGWRWRCWGHAPLGGNPWTTGRARSRVPPPPTSPRCPCSYATTLILTMSIRTTTRNVSSECNYYFVPNDISTSLTRSLSAFTM